MGSAHDHEVSVGAALRRGLTATIATVAAAALIGLLVLWPRGKAPDLGPSAQKFVNATVTGVTRGLCPSVEENATAGCQLVETRLSSVAERGRTATFAISDTDFAAPKLKTGDKVILFDAGAAAAEFRYGYVDYQRSTSMLWLVALFAVIVLVVGRGKDCARWRVWPRAWECSSCSSFPRSCGARAPQP